MQHRLAVAIAILVLAIPMAAQAQLPGLRLGVAGGPSAPLGSLGDQADTGIHLRGSLGLELPLIPLGVRGDLLWQRFPDQVSGSFNGLAGLANATWRLTFPMVQPYVVAGAGMLRYSEPDERGGQSGTDFAWAGGAGVQLRLLRLGAFVEARYLDWGRHRAVPLTFGVTF